MIDNLNKMHTTFRVLLSSYFVFLNLISASSILHLHWRIENISETWMNQWIVVYLVIGKLIVIVANLRGYPLATRKDYAIVTVLNIFYLDLLYILSKKEIFPNYKIIRYQLNLCFYFIPLFLIEAPSIFRSASAAGVIIPLAIALIAIFVVLCASFFAFFVFLTQKQETYSQIFQDENLVRRLLVEISKSKLNFLTYYALLWANGYLSGFYFFAWFTSIFLLLSTQFQISFYNREMKYNREKSSILILGAMVMVCNLINIDFDFRSLMNIVFSEVIYELGEKIANQMNLFSLTMKGFLISMLVWFINSDEYQEKYLSLRGVILFVLVMSIASICINAWKYYQNAVVPIYNGTGAKEIVTQEMLVQEFERDQKQQRKNKQKNDGDLTNQFSVILCDKMYADFEDMKMILKCTLCGFDGSNIVFGCQTYRKTIFSGYSIVKISKSVEFEVIFNSIWKYRIVPSIRVIYLTFHRDWRGLRDLIDLMEKKQLKIKLINKRKSDVQNKRVHPRLECYNSFVDQVHKALYSIMAFQKILAPFQQFHSKSILFDLYEDY